MDDAELVRQVLQGNLGAYAELVSRYTAQIAAVCRAHLPRHEAVDDLVQDTFLRGLDRLSGLREPARFGFWLYAIARNLCRDWLNDPHLGLFPLDRVPAPPSADAGDRFDRTAAVKECVRQLPVELREVIEIYYAGGRITYQEIADRLGVSFGKVNQMLTRARKLLRARLENEAAVAAEAVATST
jgi:RNA polymerase sigma-70 factor (ECF subfamily)